MSHHFDFDSAFLLVALLPDLYIFQPREKAMMKCLLTALVFLLPVMVGGMMLNKPKKGVKSCKPKEETKKGKRNLKRSGKDDSDDLSKSNSDEEDDEYAFDSGFYIAYNGPNVGFEGLNIATVEGIVMNTYNELIGCDAQVIIGETVILNQTVPSADTRRRLQRGFGLSFSLLNFYSVRGSCRGCRNSLAFFDDGFRRGRRGLLQQQEQHTYLRTTGRSLPEITPTELFNREVVVRLNRAYVSLIPIVNASASDASPRTRTEPGIEQLMEGSNNPEEPNERSNNPEDPNEGSNNPEEPNEGSNNPEESSEGSNNPEEPNEGFSNNSEEPSERSNNSDEPNEGFNTPDQSSEGSNNSEGSNEGSNNSGESNEGSADFEDEIDTHVEGLVERAQEEILRENLP